MNVSVRLFAGLRERAGTERVEVELPDDAVARDLLAAMAAPGPGQCIVAINREYARADEPIGAGDEVALIPPVSGGEGPVRAIRVTDEPLDLAALAAAVRDPRAGAVVSFEGVTRDVPSLEYEAYAEMAEPRLRAIARGGGRAPRAVRRGGRAPDRHRRAERAERDRGRLRRPPRRGVRRRARGDRPRQGRGPDLEGRGRRPTVAAQRVEGTLPPV